MQEGVMSFVERGFERLRSFHHVNDIRGSRYVKDFHEGVIQRVERCEEVQISGDEHYQV